MTEAKDEGGKPKQREGLLGAIDVISDTAAKTPSFGVGQKFSTGLDKMTGRFDSPGGGNPTPLGEASDDDQL